MILAFQQNLELQMTKRLIYISLLFILACTKGELPEPKNLDTWEPIIGYNTPKVSNLQVTYNLSVNSIAVPPPVNYSPSAAGHHNGYSFGLFGWLNIEYNGIHNNGWVSFEQPLPSGIDITITAIPGEGYEFSKWSNGQSINPITFNLSSNTDLTATFVTKDD